MAANPAYATTPRLGVGQISAANTNRDGTGTIVSVLTGVAAGTKVFEVVAQATVTTTAGMVRLYVSLDAGSTWRLFDEIAIPAVTVGANTPAVRAARLYTNLVLRDASCQLGASTHNGEAFNVIAQAGDLT